MATGQYSYPLHEAIINGDLKRVKRLVKVKSIDINKSEKIDEDEEEVSPLYLAVNYPRGEKLRVQMVKVLLSHPDLDMYMYPTQTSDEFEDKTKEKLYNYLLGKIGISLLHMCIKVGDLELVKALVSHPKIDIEDVTSGLQVATDSEYLSTPSNKKIQIDLVRVLLAHPEAIVDQWTFFPLDVLKIPENLDTWINLKMKKGTNHIQKWNKFKKKGTSLLNIWIVRGEIDLIKELIKHPKMKFDDISKGIFTAIASAHLCEPTNEQLQIDIIKTLIEHPNININVQTNGLSALHVAVVKKQFKTVEILLQHPKIYVNQFWKISQESEDQRPGKKTTPLIIALNNKDMTRLLLNHPKIDMNLTDNGICLPITMPVFDQNTLDSFKVLLNNIKIDVNAEDKFTADGSSPLMCRAIAWKYNVNDEKYPDATYYNKKAFKLLLNHEKVDDSREDGHGRNILHHMILAIMDANDQDLNSHKANVGDFYYHVSEMLEANPNLITPDKDGITPLNLAMEYHDTFGLMNDVLERYNQKDANEKAEKDPSGKNDDVFKTNLKKCCWSCDATSVKLYKCTGCKKAYYCSRSCITHDWPVHGGYCLKKQQEK